MKNLRWLAALMLIVSAGLFFVGTRIERSHEATPAIQSESGEHGDEANEHASEALPEAESESFLGLNPDSTLAVTTAIVVSVVLAAALLVARARMVAGVVGLGALVFAVFDVREALHQAGLSRGSLVVTAAVLAALHAFVAAACVALVFGEKAEPDDAGA